MGSWEQPTSRREYDDNAISGHGRVSFEGLHQLMSAMMHNTDSGQRRSYALKKVFDVIASSLGLAILSPLLLLIATAILVDTGRPVFFLQERAGLLGRPFRIIKFRSMTRDAEQRIHGEYIAADNPYVTPIGRFLRKTSLDELPEIVNVLKGDMSLVGPRPQLSEEVANYDEFQRRRLEVRPGITGWAQVNGRNSISWTERFKLDVWYIDHWTPWLDIRILFMTIGQVLRQRGLEGPPPDITVP